MVARDQRLRLLALASIGCLDDLGVYFIGPLRHDHIHHFVHHLHVGELEKALRELSESLRIGRSVERGPGRLGLQEQVATYAPQARRIDETGELYLSCLLEGCVPRDSDRDLAVERYI